MFGNCFANHPFPLLKELALTHFTTTRHLSVALAALLCLGSAQAATNFSQATYKGAKAEIKAGYKADKASCASLSDNAKDVCVEQAKAGEKVALAQLEANYSGNPKDEAKLHTAQYEARYAVAKEKCDDLSGNAKDVCVQEAKTTRDKAKGDAKLTKTVTTAITDDVSTKMKADYKLAREKCDSLTANAKDICVASAKARYNERW